MKLTRDGQTYVTCHVIHIPCLVLDIGLQFLGSVEHFARILSGRASDGHRSHGDAVFSQLRNGMDGRSYSIKILAVLAMSTTL